MSPFKLAKDGRDFANSITLSKEIALNLQVKNLWILLLLLLKKSTKNVPSILVWTTISLHHVFCQFRTLSSNLLMFLDIFNVCHLIF
jgi:hypothetical protein